MQQTQLTVMAVWIVRITAMPFTGNVFTALTGGTQAGLTGSCGVEFCRYAAHGNDLLRVRERFGQGFVAVEHEYGQTMAWLASLPKRRYRDSRLIQFGLCRRCADWTRGGLRRFSPVFQVVHHLFDDEWVFDAGINFGSAAALYRFRYRS
jgi:hypothetical protein